MIRSVAFQTFSSEHGAAVAEFVMVLAPAVISLQVLFGLANTASDRLHAIVESSKLATAYASADSSFIDIQAGRSDSSSKVSVTNGFVSVCLNQDHVSRRVVCWRSFLELP